MQNTIVDDIIYNKIKPFFYKINCIYYRKLTKDFKLKLKLKLIPFKKLGYKCIKLMYYLMC